MEPDDLSEQERLIKGHAERMQQKGVPSEQIVDFVRRAQGRLAQNDAERPLDRTQLAKGMGRGIAQGLTFNFADELEGLARSAFSDRSYDEVVGDVRRDQNEFRDKEPALAMASEVAGSVVPGVGLARLATKGASGAGRMAGRIAASGAGGGAIAGAGAGEGGIGERLPNAAIGAGVGGALGYAGGKLIEKASPHLSRGVDAVKRAAGQKVPQRLLASPEAKQLAPLLSRARMTPDDLANAAGDSPETRIFDVLGKPAARKLRGIRVLGGEGGDAVERELGERGAGQQRRLTNRLYGQRIEEDVFQTADDLMKAQLQKAKPLYEKAYAHGAVDDADINAILAEGGDDIAKLWRNAQGIARKEALSARLGGEPSDYVMPTIEEITRKPVSGGAKDAARTGSGRLTQSLGDLSDEALATEYGRLAQAQSDDVGINANLRKFESDDYIAGFARTDASMKAGGRMASRGHSFDKIEKELEKRGISKGDALWLANETAVPGGREAVASGRAMEEVVTRRGVPDVKALDYLKRAMDDEIEALAAKPHAKRALVNLRERLLSRLDDIVPDHATARSTYAGDMKLREALDAGKSALRNDVDSREIASKLAQMSPSEKELYQRGAIDAMREKIEKFGDHRDITKALANESFRKRVRAIYGKEADGVLKTLAEERRMAGNEDFILGGSQTADKAADAIGESPEAQSIIGRLARWDLMGAALEGAGAAARVPLRMVGEKNRQALSSSLLTRVSDKPKVSNLADMIRILQAEQQPAKVGRALIGTASGRATQK